MGLVWGPGPIWRGSSSSRSSPGMGVDKLVHIHCCGRCLLDSSDRPAAVGSNIVIISIIFGQVSGPIAVWLRVKLRKLSPVHFGHPARRILQVYLSYRLVDGWPFLKIDPVQIFFLVFRIADGVSSTYCIRATQGKNAGGMQSVHHTECWPRTGSLQHTGCKQFAFSSLASPTVYYFYRWTLTMLLSTGGLYREFGARVDL